MDLQRGEEKGDAARFESDIVHKTSCVPFFFLTGPERLLLERYLRVGQFLDLVHAKAKLSLRQSNGSA